MPELLLRQSDRLVEAMAKAFRRFDSPIGSVAGAGAMLALVLALLTSPSVWTGNEENYLQLAYRTFAPDAFGPDSAVFDQSRARFVGLWLMGAPIGLFGYEPAHLFLRLASCIASGLGIARFCAALRLSVMDMLCIVLLFLSLGQTAMGGGEMIGAAEPKIFAFAAGFFALGEMIDGKAMRAAVMAALATYLHMQVGAILAALTFAVPIIADRSWRRSLTAGTAYVVLIVPEMILCLADLGQSASVVRPAGMPSADYIYSIIRSPHHVAPFAGAGGWRSRALRGAFLCLLIMLLPSIGRIARDRTAVLAGSLGSILAAFLLVALAASWFDRATGALGKFYLFRPAVPLVFIALTSVFILWRNASDHQRIDRGLLQGALIATIIAMVPLAPRGGMNPLLPEERSMVAAVQRIVPPRQPILIDPGLDGRVSLIRILDRPSLVSWKFVPTNAADIYRWYGLVTMQKAVFGGHCQAIPARVDFLVAEGASRQSLEACAEALWRNDRFTLFRVRSRS